MSFDVSLLCHLAYSASIHIFGDEFIHVGPVISSRDQFLCSGNSLVPCHGGVVIQLQYLSLNVWVIWDPYSFLVDRKAIFPFLCGGRVLLELLQVLSY